MESKKEGIRFEAYVDLKECDMMSAFYNIEEDKITNTRLYSSPENNLKFNGLSEGDVLVAGDNFIDFKYPETFGYDKVVELAQTISKIENLKSKCIKVKFIGVGGLDDILESFREGAVISRVSWKDIGRSIVYRKGYTSISPNEQTVENWHLPPSSKFNMSINVKPYIQSKEFDTFSVYNLTTEDIMANDWYIVSQ